MWLKKKKLFIEDYFIEILLPYLMAYKAHFFFLNKNIF